MGLLMSRVMVWGSISVVLGSGDLVGVVVAVRKVVVMVVFVGSGG